MKVWCFQCRIEYVEGVEVCVDCLGETIDTKPLQPHHVGGPGDDQLSYEFNAWPVEARASLDKRLWGDNLKHSWMGGSLIILAADEDAVDAHIDVIEQTTRPTFPEGAELVEYELTDYPQKARNRLVLMIEMEGIAFQLEGEDVLLVQESDEAPVDDIFERLAAEAPERLNFGPGIEGVDPLSVVQDLFVSADKMRRNANDSRARKALLAAIDDAHEIPLPWGYDSRFWRSVLDKTDTVLDAIETDERDEIKAAAKAITDDLRTVL